jgi:LmbE family N-acetylglucosaminyl deacetylase
VTPLIDPMKPTPNSPELAPLLAFGAHPDDIEFGCGGVIARETRAGRKAHFVVCSRGESGTYGTPDNARAEAKKSAALLGATLEFLELDGDAHLEIRAAHAIKLASVLRRVRPASCSRRVWWKISIPITRAWENWCVMQPGWPVTAA